MDMRALILFSCVAVMAYAALPKHFAKRQTATQQILDDQCSRVPQGHDPNQAFHIAHPDICNAIVTCNPTIGKAWHQCTFCPNGTRTLISDQLATCDHYTNPAEWTNLWNQPNQIPQECGNRRVVLHQDQTDAQSQPPCFMGARP